MDLRRARTLLESERERLRRMREEADGHLRDSLEESTGELSSFDQHPGDLGSETLEREQDDSVRLHADSELAEVDAGLRRIDAGQSGTCVVCGVRIPDDRLETLPRTRWCVRHQRERERAQRADREGASDQADRADRAHAGSPGERG